MKRRNFLRNTASAAILAQVASCRPSAGKKEDEPSGSLLCLYHGRTEDYRDFAVIDRGLKITAIETYSRPDIAVVRVTTDSGQEGWGQISTYNADIATTVLHRNLAELVLGHDPANIDQSNDRCIERNLKYPWSYVNRALGGIDTAIWDLYGKILGKPVCELLGGEARPVRIYGSSMSRAITPEDELERMTRLRDDRGITAFKFRIGTEAGHNRDAWPGRTDDMIRTIGNALSESCDLLADANSCYTPDRAIHFGMMMQSYGIGQFEEPCPYWETEWIREVTGALTMDVSGGEQDNDIAKWRRMIRAHVMDIIQPDPLYLGGITRTWRTALMADEAGIPCIPHSANHAMVTIFAHHLMNAIPNPGKYLEYSIEFDAAINREARALFEPQPEIRDGALIVPPGPGWGVRYRREWLEGAEYRASRVEPS
jgi:L-alanine-DL-glutamate epimerase-like enolase superfamily enzyme